MLEKMLKSNDFQISGNSTVCRKKKKEDSASNKLCCADALFDKNNSCSRRHVRVTP